MEEGYALADDLRELVEPLQEGPEGEAPPPATHGEFEAQEGARDGVVAHGRFSVEAERAVADPGPIGVTSRALDLDA